MDYDIHHKYDFDIHQNYLNHGHSGCLNLDSNMPNVTTNVPQNKIFACKGDFLPL